jgi:hypothetical protein
MCPKRKNTDTMLHRLTTCQVAQNIWRWICSRLAMTQRTKARHIPKQWLIQNTQYKHTVTVWFIANGTSCRNWTTENSCENSTGRRICQGTKSQRPAGSYWESLKKSRQKTQVYYQRIPLTFKSLTSVRSVENIWTQQTHILDSITESCHASVSSKFTGSLISLLNM